MVLLGKIKEGVLLANTAWLVKVITDLMLYGILNVFFQLRTQGMRTQVKTVQNQKSQIKQLLKFSKLKEQILKSLRNSESLKELLMELNVRNTTER